MSDSGISDKNQPIDVVITWVDGDDPEYRSRMEPYLGGKHRAKIPGAHSTRFSSVNEIRYCLLSIFRFAPFVRNVYIVTDKQDPGLDKDINTYFPERSNSVRIVDHSEIFRDYEEYLPTFNSRSIQNMVWRIEGLSDNFVYFNDDTFLIRQIEPEDWFINNRPVLRGNWIPAPLLRILWNHIRKAVNHKILGNTGFQPRPSFHLGQWNAASLLGFRWRYFYSGHIPFAISRRTVEEFFMNNRGVIEKNSSSRFRHHEQFIFVSLSYHLELLKGNRQIARSDLSYLQPANRYSGYIDNKLRHCERDHTLRYMCVQSLDMCTMEEQRKLLSWMEKILGL